MAENVKIGIVSIGEMGLGIAKLLTAHGYTVLTNITGRSEYTHKRAATASITLLESDAALAAQADYIFSIVPPRDAVATAKRFTSLDLSKRTSPLYYLDLNAVSPGRVREIAEDFKTNVPDVIFIDGGILGGPPKQLEENPSGQPGAGWKRPALPLSGPQLAHPRLAQVLNSKHLGPKIGAASGMKCCFGSLIKGLIAISIQSFSTAEALGIFDEMQEFLKHFQPALQESTTRMVTEIPPKAGRWIDEMWEIGRCFGEEGGWDNAEGQESADVYRRIAEVYRTIAEETVLGQERQEHRMRGTTAQDVAVAIGESLQGKEKS